MLPQGFVVAVQLLAPLMYTFENRHQTVRQVLDL